MKNVPGAILEQRSEVIKRYGMDRRTEAGWVWVRSVRNREDIPNLNCFMRRNKWEDFIIKKMK